MVLPSWRCSRTNGTSLISPAAPLTGSSSVCCPYGRVGAEFIEVFGREPVGIEVTFEFGAVSQDFCCRLGFEVEDRPRFQNSVRAESGTVGVFRLEAVAILVRGGQAGDVSADRRRRAFGVGQRLFAGDARPRVEPFDFDDFHDAAGDGPPPAGSMTPWTTAVVCPRSLIAAGLVRTFGSLKPGAELDDLVVGAIGYRDFPGGAVVDRHVAAVVVGQIWDFAQAEGGAVLVNRITRDSLAVGGDLSPSPFSGFAPSNVVPFSTS